MMTVIGQYEFSTDFVKTKFDFCSSIILFINYVDVQKIVHVEFTQIKLSNK